MASGHLEQLGRLIARNPNISGTDGKLLLARLAQDLQERAIAASSTSASFYVDAVKALSRIRGSSHAGLRMDCIWECGKFFEMHGLHAPAIEAANQLEALARKTNESAWLRKSYTFGGIIYAEFGNVAEAIIRHSKALDLVARENASNQILVFTNIS